MKYFVNYFVEQFIILKNIFLRIATERGIIEEINKMFNGDFVNIDYYGKVIENNWKTNYNKIQYIDLFGSVVMNCRSEIKNLKRIVVKVGTSTLTYDNGNINLTRIEKLTRVLSDMMNAGKEVVLVTSGAIGVGVSKLKLKEKPSSIREKQAVAAVGQCELMHIYSKFFGEYSHTVGQVLLTRDVVEDDHIRDNVCNTFETLIENKIVPIVNENDTVSIDEIENIVRFGDNDNLSAIVSGLVNADLLVILSDIDGFYDCDPRKNPNSKLIKQIDKITPELESCAGGAGSSLGTGGMVTKLCAAKTATSLGVNMILANGKEPEILLDIIDGQEVGTLFAKGGF